MGFLHGRVAMVTGAGNGIGAATCVSLVKEGVKVLGCDIDTEALQKLEGDIKSQIECHSKDDWGTFTPIKCDLRHESEILKMFDDIRKDFDGVDVCVVCAGVGYRASLLDGATADWRAMMDVNVMAYCICIREAVKQMEEKGSGSQGHVVLINSGAGHRVRVNKPLFNFYNATKHAVTAIAEGVRSELRAKKSDIRISMISPGVVQTKFTHRMFEGEEQQVDAFYKSYKVLESNDLADAILFTLKAPPHVQVHDVRMCSTEEND